MRHNIHILQQKNGKNSLNNLVVSDNCVKTHTHKIWIKDLSNAGALVGRYFRNKTQSKSEDFGLALSSSVVNKTLNNNNV